MNHHHPQALTVGTVGLNRYTGSLGRFLKRQAEEKAAATLHSMRDVINGLLADSDVFTPDECQRCTANVEQCQCVAQLQRWFRNAYRVRNERLAAQAVAQRSKRGRTADYAAELAYDVRQAEFLAETGYSHSDILSL